METDIVQALSKLQIELEKISKIEDEKINIFTAVGMANQEIKHSSFFAWLLDPKKPHRLKNEGISVLHKFLDRLYDYIPEEYGKTVGNKKVKSNEEVLASATHSIAINSKSELFDLLQGIVIIKTEEIIVNAESRIDILIDLPDSKTVIIVENKVESQPHTDQLRRYQTEVEHLDSKFRDYKRKIYVYLSPYGEIPKNIGGDEKYNDEYCVFDYRQICNIVKDVMRELQVKKDTVKIRHILEDYIDMCKTNIFHENPEAFEICRKIMADAELRAAFETLTNYNHTAVESKVLEYCCREILGDQNAEGTRLFYTPAMENYFFRHGETFTGNECRCVCQPEYDGARSSGDQKLKGYVIFAEITTESTKKWTKAQDMLAAKLGKKKSGKYTRLITKVHLLTASECRDPWDKVLPQLEKQLGIFKKELLMLENILNTL